VISTVSCYVTGATMSTNVEP